VSTPSPHNIGRGVDMRIKKKMLKVGAQKTRREIEIYKKKRNLHLKARITYILEKNGYN
jgi:hypothetical protein